MKIEKESYCSDIAICFEPAANKFWAAAFDRQGIINISYFAPGDTLHAELLEWRLSLGQRAEEATVFRFVPNFFMEQTRVASVAAEVLALPDADLIEWLAQASANGLSGNDGKPIFESNLENSAYDFARLPNGFISLTEVPRKALEVSRQSLIQAALPDISSEDIANYEHFGGGELPEFLQAVETRLRVIARYLSEAEKEYFASLTDDETVAFFSFTPEGVGFALWNPSFSFFVELGDLFHLHIEEGVQLPDGMDKAAFVGQSYGESVESFLNEQFYKRIVPDDESAAPIKLRRVYWTASANFIAPLETLLEEFSEQSGFPFVHCSAATEEMVVEGLLLGCAEETTKIIPSINLANDISLQYEAVNAERAEIRNQKQSARRRMAMVFVLLPIACAVGLIGGLWLNNWRIGRSLENRSLAAATETARLQPFINRQNEYVKTLSWYEAVLQQIIGLRKKQPAALQFAARLDPLFPSGGAFFVSDLKLAPGGSFEIRGLARDEFAVSEFVRQMEFAADDRGERYFSNLTLEFKQGSFSSLPGAASTALGSLGNLGVGVSGFFVKGNFAPAGILKAQEIKPVAVTAVAPPVPPVAAATPSPLSANTPIGNNNSGTKQ